MMKQTYEKAAAEMIIFANTDVIATSGKTYCIDPGLNTFENAFD